jgi:hypothetical protein
MEQSQNSGIIIPLDQREIFFQNLYGPMERMLA